MKTSTNKRNEFFYSFDLAQDLLQDIALKRGCGIVLVWPSSFRLRDIVTYSNVKRSTKRKTVDNNWPRKKLKRSEAKNERDRMLNQRQNEIKWRR